MPEILTRRPEVMLVFLLLAMIEWGWRRFGVGRDYNVRAAAASIGVAAGQFVLKPLMGAVLTGIFTGLHALAPIKLQIDDVRVWVAAFVLVEFTYYWFHRLSHTVNWLWATHAVHHSANEMTLPAAVRLGWTGPLSGGWLFFVPLVVAGFPPIMVLGLLGASLIYQFGLHTEAIGKLWGPIEFVLNTPSHHRTHHASDVAYLDCNFGGVLILFDRLFGSFQEEPEDRKLTYGLTTPVTSHNPIMIALHQWMIMARAWAGSSDWHTRLRILFGKPSELDRLRHVPPTGGSLEGTRSASSIVHPRRTH